MLSILPWALVTLADGISELLAALGWMQLTFIIPEGRESVVKNHWPNDCNRSNLLTFFFFFSYNMPCLELKMLSAPQIATWMKHYCFMIVMAFFFCLSSSGNYLVSFFFYIFIPCISEKQALIWMSVMCLRDNTSMNRIRLLVSWFPLLIFHLLYNATFLYECWRWNSNARFSAL